MTKTNMTKRIYHAVLLTSLAVLLCGLLLAAGCLSGTVEESTRQHLYSQLQLAAQVLETSGPEALESLETEDLRMDLRLSLIEANGRVLYDTAADAEAMENHSDRQEVAQALAYGWGESYRTSATLLQKTHYAALRLEDGKVLRAAVSQDTVLALMAGALPWFILGACVAAALSWILAGRLSRRIIAPLAQLDLEQPLENEAYDELTPLLRRLHRQHQQIDAQMLELRQRADQFRHITHSMQEGLVLLDAQGKILSMNPAAAALFGAREDAVGQDFLTVERDPDLSRALDNALAQGHARLQQQRQGRRYQFDLSRSQSGDQTLGLLLLAQDITEQELAERSRREFTANVSHELKTPLTSIMASAELIEQGLVQPQDLPRFVGHIRQEAARLLSLIEDIIRLSQLDEGNCPPTEPVDLAAVAREVVEQLADSAQLAQVELSLEAEPFVLQGAPRLLYEIVYNLVENAVKYNVSGGWVRVSVAPEQGGCCLTVADSGIGIPADQQERVFERFYRVDKSHSKLSGGTGLGLSIVKHAVASFGAQLSLESQPGQGTCVRVHFPQ